MTVNKKTCIACQACINSCPVQAISLKDGKAFIDKKVCIRCGLCMSICPVQAIEDK